MDSKINKVEYKMIHFPGKIHLIRSDQELANVAAQLNSASEFGFDYGN